MTKNLNLRELQTEAFKNQIAKPKETDKLSEQLQHIKSGLGYAIIASANMEQLNNASDIISEINAEDITLIAKDICDIKGFSSALDDYNKSIKRSTEFTSKDDSKPKIYFLNTVKDITIENEVSFGDMFSQDYKNYNVTSHIKLINEDSNLSQLEKNTFIKETKNSISLEVNLDSNLEKCSELLSSNDADMIIFKMNTNSKQKLPILLDHMIGLEVIPVLACYIAEDNVSSAKNITAEFIQACRERDLHPGGFVYESLEDISVVKRLSDDLTRYPYKNIKKNELVAKNDAWS